MDPGWNIINEEEGRSNECNWRPLHLGVTIDEGHAAMVVFSAAFERDPFDLAIGIGALDYVLEYHPSGSFGVRP